MVKVYTKDGCPKCKATERMMRDKSIEFEEINVSKHPEYIEGLKARGISSLPVIDTENDSWTGFRPDRINSLVG